MRTSLLVALSACVLAAASSAAGAQTAERVVVTIPGQTPSPNLSPGIRVGNILYASGQLGMSRDGDNSIESQTRQALENTRRVLEAGGTTMANVIRCTVFLTRAEDFQAMNRVYREFFPSNPPARSTVVVAALVVPAAVVEIECTAVVPTS